MSKITTADVRKWETSALADGVIKAGEVKDLKKLVGTEKLGSNEKAALTDILQHDRFESKGAKTGVVKLGATKQESSLVLGKEVAKGVFVQKSFSPVNGFTTKEQAVAAARMSGSPNAIAVESKGGRWHAVDVNKHISQSDAKSGVVVPHDCPPAAFKSKYDAAMAATGDDKVKQFKQLAAATYGVPEDQVNVITSTDQKPKPGMININTVGTMAEGAAGQITSGCNCGQSHENFNPGSKDYAVQIKADQLADPVKAAGVMFHELTHADDYAKAQAVFKAYEKASPKEAAALKNADFSKRGSEALSGDAVKAQADLQKWIFTTKDKPVAGMTTAEKWKALGYVTGQGGATEATAYSKSFMQEFRANAKALENTTMPTDKAGKVPYFDQLGGQLVKYAEGQTSGRVPLNAGSMADVKAELKAYYATLTPKEQDKFKEVLTYVKAKFPKSDIAGLELP